MSQICTQLFLSSSNNWLYTKCEHMTRNNIQPFQSVSQAGLQITMSVIISKSKHNNTQWTMKIDLKS